MKAIRFHFLFHILAALFPLHLNAASLRILPSPEGYTTVNTTFSISDDGSMIVGTVRTAEGNRGVVWTDGIYKQIGEVEPGNYASSATVISGDGSVVMGTTLFYPGYFYESINGAVPTLFIYTIPPGGFEWTYVRGDISGISLDGSIRVGGDIIWQDGDPPTVTTISTTANNETVGLRFNGVSADGGTLFGDAGFPAESTHIKKGWVRWGSDPTYFRWIEENDFVYENSVEDSSASGEVVVGSIQNAVQYGSYGFVWQRPSDPSDPDDKGTFFTLDTISATPYQQAYSVSGDGRIIVGYEHSTDSGMDIAVMWNADNGFVPVNLNSLVGDAGGFNMAYAYEISGDGSTIVGTNYYQLEEPHYTVFELKLSAWEKYPPVQSEAGLYANTYDWLGLLEVSLDPWFWCEKASCWLYMPEASANAERGWMYAPDQEVMQLVPIEGTGWAYCYGIDKWVYPHASGWLYMM